MRLTAQIICDILKYGMELRPEQIWIYNQRHSIPEDKQLYVIVGMSSPKVYGNNNVSVGVTGGMYDVASQYVSETIQIDLMSYTMEAQERYYEVLGSLVSTYSLEYQMNYGLKIASIPTSVNDVSGIDGATMLNRIVITLQVWRKYDTIISAAYYDTFSDVAVETQ